jgi:uncharacterized membrane protein YbjE (DUF340 family)
LRLDPQFRWAIYLAFVVLFVTGAAWLVADKLKESADVWQSIAANLLMVHGGAAIVTLMLLGALIPLHLRRTWRAGKNLFTGTAMATFNVVLIATAFGLYYHGSEEVRPWMSRIHYVFGLALPALLLVHVIWGRRNCQGRRVAAR